MGEQSEQLHKRISCAIGRMADFVIPISVPPSSTMLDLQGLPDPSCPFTVGECGVDERLLYVPVSLSLGSMFIDAPFPGWRWGRKCRRAGNSLGCGLVMPGLCVTDPHHLQGKTDMQVWNVIICARAPVRFRQQFSLNYKQMLLYILTPVCLRRRELRNAIWCCVTVRACRHRAIGVPFGSLNQVGMLSCVDG